MSPFLARPALCLLTASLIGCSAPPEVGSALSDAARRADYPRILPLDGLLAQRPDVSTATDFAAPLASRATALQSRAARLRGPIVDRTTRRRMQEALNRR